MNNHILETGFLLFFNGDKELCLENVEGVDTFIKSHRIFVKWKLIDGW